MILKGGGGGGVAASLNETQIVIINRLAYAVCLDVR